MSFGNHLCANQDVEFVIMPGSQNFIERTSLADTIAVEARNADRWQEAPEGFFNLFGSKWQDF